MTSARFTGSDICNLGLPGEIELEAFWRRIPRIRKVGAKGFVPTKSSSV